MRRFPGSAESSQFDLPGFAPNGLVPLMKQIISIRHSMASFDKPVDVDRCVMRNRFWYVIERDLRRSPAGYRLPFDAEVASNSVTFRQSVANSGRFILSQQRCKNICRQFGQINRILAIGCIASKRTLRAINLITPAGFIATPFAAPVDVTGAVCAWEQFGSGRSRRRGFAHLFARFRVVARTVDRFRKSDSRHALLSSLRRSRCEARSR